MRELKFRAWDTGAKRWTSGVMPVLTGISLELKPAHSGIIIEQYTGLKDKNGKEIYEGDIVKLCGKVAENKCALYRVFWESAYAAFDLVALEKVKSDVGYLTEVETESRYKVIGNIHENPELLEREDGER